jgi:hypothetical protein
MLHACSLRIRTVASSPHSHDADTWQSETRSWRLGSSNIIARLKARSKIILTYVEPHRPWLAETREHSGSTCFKGILSIVVALVRNSICILGSKHVQETELASRARKAFCVRTALRLNGSISYVHPCVHAIPSFTGEVRTVRTKHPSDQDDV